MSGSTLTIIGFIMVMFGGLAMNIGQVKSQKESRKLQGFNYAQGIELGIKASGNQTTLQSRNYIKDNVLNRNWPADFAAGIKDHIDISN